MLLLYFRAILNEIWIKILNEKNPLIFFRYTVSPAYEQFIAQNNRLSIKPCLLNICSVINETIVIILLRDITGELSPCKRVNIVIVSKIEFIYCECTVSKADLKFQNTRTYIYYIYTYVWRSWWRESRRSTRKKICNSWRRKKETRLLSLWGSNPSDNNKNTFRFSYFNSKWRERA